MIANEAGLPGHSLGAIEIFDRSAFVEVPTGAAERVIRALSRLTFRNRPVEAARARPIRDGAHRPFRGEREHRPPYGDGRPTGRRPPYAGPQRRRPS